MTTSAAAAGPGTVRVGVTVTFLRMARRPAEGPALPADASLQQVVRPTVAFYRFLYNTVGQDYVWWLRRTVPDGQIAGLLAHPDLSVHVLYRGGAPAGFFEIDRRARPVTNLSYFGLLPHAVGQGIGPAFLHAAVREAWRGGTEAVTVNTCTADHPRALPGYERVGFGVTRRVDEVWDVPLRLGLKVPERLLLP